MQRYFRCLLRKLRQVLHPIRATQDKDGSWFNSKTFVLKLKMARRYGCAPLENPPKIFLLWSKEHFEFNMEYLVTISHSFDFKNSKSPVTRIIPRNWFKRVANQVKCTCSYVRRDNLELKLFYCKYGPWILGNLIWQQRKGFPSKGPYLGDF